MVRLTGAGLQSARGAAQQAWEWFVGTNKTYRNVGEMHRKSRLPRNLGSCSGISQMAVSLADSVQ